MTCSGRIARGISARRADRNDVIAALAPLSDAGTLLATTAERAFSRALSGGCTTPLAAYAQWEEGRLWIRGYLARRYRVTGVPKTVVDEEIEILGALPQDAFVEQALQRFSLAPSQPEDQPEPRP